MKGSMLDLFFIIPLIFIIAIIVIFSAYTLNTFDQHFDKERPEAFNATINNTKTALGTFDYMYMFILIGLTAAVLVGAFLVRTHPVFFIFSFFMLAILIILSGIFSDIFGKMMETSTLVSTANQYPLIVLTMKYLPKVVLGIGALVAIVLYAKGGVQV